MKIPEGWQLVPVEPTQAMADAAWKYGNEKTSDAPDPVYAYKAMLAAAPTPPATGRAADRVRELLDELSPESRADLIDYIRTMPATPPAQEVEPEQIVFYIMRKPGLVPQVCRPIGNDLADNLRDWFKHHPGATIDLVRVNWNSASHVWVNDGIEYLQMLDDGGWVPDRPDDKLREAAKKLLRILNEGGNRAEAMKDLDAELNK